MQGVFRGLRGITQAQSFAVLWRSDAHRAPAGRDLVGAFALLHAYPFSKEDARVLPSFLDATLYPSRAIDHCIVPLRIAESVHVVQAAFLL